jgi:hypothetical protein
MRSATCTLLEQLQKVRRSQASNHGKLVQAETLRQVVGNISESWLD